jgi:calpain
VTEDGQRPSPDNPQYLITIVEPDDGDESGNCSIVVGLMQMYRRKNITAEPDFVPLGFWIYTAVSIYTIHRL